jgi:hypothetical protein
MVDNVIYQELGGIDLLKLMLNAKDFQAPEPNKVMFTIPGLGEIFIKKVTFSPAPHAALYQGGFLDRYDQSSLGLALTAKALVESLTGMVLDL